MSIPAKGRHTGHFRENRQKNKSESRKGVGDEKRSSVAYFIDKESRGKIKAELNEKIQCDKCRDKAERYSVGLLKRNEQ